MQTRFDALIIGAGPAGSSAAILLARAGWSVALVDKNVFPRRKVCGECLAARNLPLLEALGIGAEFTKLAGPELRQVALMRGTRTVVANLPTAPDRQHNWGRALGRETLDTLLLERARAAGAVVLQPWAVQKLVHTAGLHQCTVRDGVSERLMLLQAPVAILANGSWEPLPAERAAPRLARSGSDLLAFKANFVNTCLPTGLLPVLLFEGGYGGMVLADQGMVSLACCIRSDRLEALRHAMPGRSAGDVVESMLKRECQGVAQALLGAQRCGTWLASGPLAPGVRVHGTDGVFRIGNAAGEAHPIIGEGMSMAMQSAWLLCNRLVPARQQNGTVTGAQWQRKVQKDYAAEWCRHFGPRLRLAATFAQLALRPTASAALFALVGRWPALLTRGANWSGKVHCVADIGLTQHLTKATTWRKPMTTEERIRAMLLKDYKFDPAQLTLEMPLEELGIDSIGMAELVFNIEDEFKLTAPEEAVSLLTLGDVVRFIDGLIAVAHAEKRATVRLPDAAKDQLQSVQ